MSSKPVSYYLHTIDRTKLENYFQGLKTKGNGNGDGKSFELYQNCVFINISHLF